MCVPAIFKPGHDAIHNPVSSLLERVITTPLSREQLPSNPRLLKSSQSMFLKKHQSVPPLIAASSFSTFKSCRCFATTHAGGANRDRTGDLLLAKQALSQLSYGPIGYVVGLDGVEPSTPALSRRCSNQLSYRPAGVLPVCACARARVRVCAWLSLRRNSR